MPGPVFISYSHDSPEHKDAILALSERLREEGVECIIDQYEEAPEEGWPLWCERQVARAAFVLVACTETYLRRFRGEEAPDKGLGGTWEGHIITQELYNAQGKNTKYIPFAFHRADFAHIPTPLQSATRYQLFESYEALYRRLTAQPFISKSTLGAVIAKAPRLPPRPSLERRQDFETIWHVRHRRNPFFTGRQQVLDDLRRALETRGTAALTGLGGLGKTQTAIEYAWRHRALYPAVFWVDADSRETLLTGFAAIALLLDLPSANAQDQQQTVADVHHWLEVNPGWLLILDNADDLPMLQNFLPPEANGHLLLTTRAHATSALAVSLPVRSMTPEEGALLLLRRAAVLAKDSPFNDADQAKHRIALDLSKELGGLPLALDQAGAFIEASRLGLSEYAALYDSEKATLLADRGTLGGHPSVTVTFTLAFQKVTETSPAAADLIRLCAFLAPDAIPEEIFQADDPAILGEHLGPASKNKLSLTRLIAEACRFSLLERDTTNRTLNIHRLVQIVIRQGMPDANRTEWAERAVRLIDKAFPYIEYANWALCQKLIAHAQTCANWILEWKFDFIEASRLLNQTAFYLEERALYDDAMALYQHALAIREESLGSDHPRVANSLNNLAELCRKQGRYDDAMPLYKRALAISEKAQGLDHPDVATILNNLAVLYREQGKYDDAMPLYERALAICEKELGPDHPNVATSLNNLALLYDTNGKGDDALPLYKRALAIREKALGPDHPDVATSLNNLAALDCSQVTGDDALSLYKRALTIWEKALGPDHPTIADGLNNLAVLYRRQGNIDNALPLYQRALAITEKTLGPDHPTVARSFNNIAVLFHNQGKYDDALPLCQRALAIWEKALGPDHPNVALSLNNLAALYDNQGKHADAQSLRQRALAITDKANRHE